MNARRTGISTGVSVGVDVGSLGGIWVFFLTRDSLLALRGLAQRASCCLCLERRGAKWHPFIVGHVPV